MNFKNLMAIMTIAAAPVVAGAQEFGAGIKMENLDKTANPTEDFYQYACGGWMKLNPLPAAYSRFGSFDQLGEDNNKRVNAILDDMLKGSFNEGTIERKLGDFYKMALDQKRRNKEGVKPVMPIINDIEAAKSVADLQALQLKYTPFGYGVPMGMGFGADEKNAKMNILNVYQGGLTLGQKEYYLDDDKATSDIRAAYKQHVVNMFRLFGFKQAVAQKKMEAVLKVETALAKVSKSRTELRDVEANYNKMTLKEFKAKYPNVKLEELMNAEGAKSEYMQELIVGQPAFVEGANKVLGEMTADEMKAYMEWDVIHSAANYLSDKVRQENFDFFGKTMRGSKEEHPLWKRATAQVESVMGEALGKIYCERYFPASSKARMEKLVENLQVSLAERILAQDWMSTKTKMAALEKLSKFYVKIGYPNKWKDMSGLTIDPSKSYYENVKACRAHWNSVEVKEKAGQPVDRDEWFMTPQTVNAYYNPTTNEICFPAGILQYPFFDPASDDAFNYGAIGVVIGHEMTHGFDDQGCHFDGDGNMRDWWTKEDAENFKKIGNQCADFFSEINVLPDLKANGRFTLGENLADHGGLMVAFNAYKNATKNAPLKTIDGLTPEQRFFLAYSGVWAGNITEKEIRNRTKSDPHSLGRWRVNGTLPHIDMWYDAFNVKSSDKMYIAPEKRLKLW
ncbi:M13 family peptidase [Palleniella muris]|uniref:M13 family peptidase n=1 Tax=Palleniella muris TaxID=3038145 RepID=A0AC61QTC4_9BACT|nr:M13 family metallopeptidase [Palleniella muris]TGX83609.1 M13 family peptidase [Palleniella muris]